MKKGGGPRVCDYWSPLISARSAGDPNAVIMKLLDFGRCRYNSTQMQSPSNRKLSWLKNFCQKVLCGREICHQDVNHFFVSTHRSTIMMLRDYHSRFSAAWDGRVDKYINTQLAYVYVFCSSQSHTISQQTLEAHSTYPQHCTFSLQTVYPTAH